MTSRRSFLGSVPAIAALPRAVVAEEAPRTVHGSLDPWVEVHPENLRFNVEQIHRRVEARPILAVVKNNGYGLGVANAAGLLEPLPAIAGFAVVKLQEALALRDAGIRKPVLVMASLAEADLEEAVRREITSLVFTPVADALERIAAKLQRSVPIQVCVDTGIGRLGVPYRKAAALIHDLAARQSVSIQGTMMTFTEDPDFDREQLLRFRSLCEGLKKQGALLGRMHAASSFALFRQPDAFLDMVRPGMAIYGAYSEPEFRNAGVLELRPAVSLKARVAYVKQLKKADSAGYNRAYVAQDDVWVATLPVGHADGWPRAAAKGARVRIGGELYPVIASVSASHTIVEIGREPRVQIGDVATLFDWQEGSRPEDVAAACSSSVYDLTMHLNPLLPRRVL